MKMENISNPYNQLKHISDLSSEDIENNKN